jgi:hypothetical protein
MDIIVHDPGRYHVSLDTVWEFEEAIELTPDVHLVSSRDSVLMHVPNIIWRLLFRAMRASPGLIPHLKDDGPKAPAMFSVLMGPNFRKTLPRFLAEGHKGAYLFDAWPRAHEKICHFADACALEHLFVSSSQAAAQLNLQLRTTKCHWVPEGITPANYFLAFTPERDIDVLQLGRRFNTYHQLVNDTLVKARKTYVYEKEPGHIIFPNRLDMIEGLLRSKISICVPLSVSHPDRASGIETMTIRYLQSMLSKCLIVGHAPAEMIRSFGYNPLIEIDYTQPGEQLLDILAHMDRYQPLIEKNYQAVREHHTWLKRWEQVRAILRGDTPAPMPQPATPAETK